MTIPATSASTPPGAGDRGTGAGHHFGRDPGADRARRHPGRVGPGPGAVQGQRAYGAGVHPVPHEHLGRGELLQGEVLDEDAIIAARPALWGGRLFCSHPAFPWGKVPRRGG